MAKDPAAAKYPGLNRITDPDVRAVAKYLFDMVGGLQQQVPAIGSVSQPLTAHLDANKNQLKSLADPTAPQDAVTLQYLHKYVESRVKTVTAAAVAPPPALPPSDGPTIPAPPPTPPPPPPSPPGQGGTFSATDMLALGGVIIENSPPDIATWAQTATLTLFDFQQGGVLVDFTKRTLPTDLGGTGWPDYTPPGFTGPLQYTLWIFLNIAGQWYGSGVIQYWWVAANLRNGGPPSGVAANWYYDSSRWGPMTGYQPQVGESVGFMVSAGNARNETGVTSVKERSQTILIPFPSDSGVILT